MPSVKIEALVESLGLNPGFWESAGQLSGREFDIADERQLNQRTLLYDVVVEVCPAEGVDEPPLVFDVDSIRWDPEKRRIVMVAE